MKFPVTITHRNSKVKVYGPARNFAYYRLAYTVAGKRRVQTFTAYSDAREAGERVVRELANGSQAAGLTATQSRDALAALERLQTLFQQTGRRTSLLAAVSEYAEASARLTGGTLQGAIDGYLANAVKVRRKDLAEAVDEFLRAAEPLARSVKGQRAQISAKYAYNRRIQLDRFAKTFTATAVSELTKEHLDAFISSLGEFSSKSRNHYRAAVRQFLQWAVRKDYLSLSNRLGEAEAMRPEHANIAEIAFYTPAELYTLLAMSDDAMRPLIAIGGLAGLRTAELLRLEWADVWRVPGHIEITARKSKTRARRLVEICPALAAWLEPYRSHSSGKLWTLHEITFQEHFRDLCERAKVKRKANGLRHSFCSYHFALNANENQTAQQAGNSPDMIHAHYKGLATKAEAEKWFAVQPATAAGNMIPLPSKARA